MTWLRRNNDHYEATDQKCMLFLYFKVQTRTLYIFTSIIIFHFIDFLQYLVTCQTRSF